MYPYDENDNLNNENVNGPDGSSANECGGESSTAPDGSYRMTRPDAGKSFDAREKSPCYRDANYTSESGSAPGY